MDSFRSPCSSGAWAGETQEGRVGRAAPLLSGVVYTLAAFVALAAAAVVIGFVAWTIGLVLTAVF